MRPRCAAVPNPSKSAPIPAGCARRNLTIAHSFAAGCGGTGSRLSHSRRRAARLQVLAHIASITAGHGSIRIGHTSAMRGVVGPGAVSTQAAVMAGIEIVPVNEAVVDDHAVVAPAGMPSPAAPATPPPAEIEPHRDPNSKSKVTALSER